MHEDTRRSFLLKGGIASATLMASGATGFSLQEKGGEKAGEEVGVSPTEDLMREHGLLNRVLLIYEESARRLGGKDDLDPKVLTDAASIIKSFIENYHEKLEEDYLFPRFEKAGKLTNLVAVLRQQLRDLLSELNEPDRYIVKLLMEGFSISQIATQTGMTYSNVATRLHRLRRRARNPLK